MNEENIFGFIDGDLSTDQEKELFRHLAEDDAMRSKMRAAYAVNGEISKNYSHFAPSTATSAALFAGLGISATPAANASPKPESFQSATAAKSKYYSKYFNRNTAIVAVASALITSLCFLAVPNNKTEFAAKVKTVEVPVYVKSEIPAQKIIEKTKYIVKTVYVDREIGVNNNTLASNYETAPNVVSESDNSADKSTDLATEAKTIKLSSVSNGTTRIENFNRANDIAALEFAKNIVPEASLPGRPVEDKNFMIEFRGAGYYNSPKETIMPSYLATFDNMALMGLYRVSSEFRIGADIRRERYFQVFKAYNAIGDKVTIEQQPNFTSLCLALRYDFKILNKVRVFAQGQTGYAKGSWVNRGGFGISYEIGSGVSALIGVERSLQTFKSGSDYYLSIKNSLQYGLNYRF